MPRILVVGINYAPEAIGTGKYTSEMCAWLAARGHQVRMVTAPPYYPAWKVWPGYRRWWFQSESLQGVEVVRCPLWVPARPNGLKRLLMSHPPLEERIAALRSASPEALREGVLA